MLRAAVRWQAIIIIVVKTVVLALLVIMGLGTAAQDDLARLQQSITRHFVGKNVTARFPYSNNNVVLAPDGTCQSGCARGSWAGDGTHVVRRLEITAEEVVITCDRLVVYYDMADQPRAVLTVYPIRFRVKLNRPPNAPSVLQALRSVFRDTNEPSPNGLPPDPERALDFEIRKAKSHFLVREKGSSEWKPASELNAPLAIGILANGEKAYLVSKAVTPPRAVSAPDPKFPRAGQNERHQGKVVFRVVVDSFGRVQAMKVESATGLAFMHSAVAAVARWEFDPATLDGRPVACEINVEVNFRVH